MHDPQSLWFKQVLGVNLVDYTKPASPDLF